MQIDRAPNVHIRSLFEDSTAQCQYVSRAESEAPS